MDNFLNLLSSFPACFFDNRPRAGEPLNHTIHIGKRVRLEWRMEIGTRANALALEINVIEFGFEEVGNFL